MSVSGSLVQSAGPKVSTIRLASIDGPNLTLDAKLYQHEFVLAQRRVAGCGYPSAPLSEVAGAFVPGRMKLVTTPHSLSGAPYLRAHDAFETRPRTRRYVAESRVQDYSDYLLRQGMILTPSSGRNLGPLAYVGKKLAAFAMTDILRIVPFDMKYGAYLFGYLRTPTGQALIRRGRTGTTVDHLAPDDVLRIPVVDLGAEGERIGEEIARALIRLDSARLALDELEAELHREAGLGLPPPRGRYLDGKTRIAFGIRARDLALRVDAAFYAPDVRRATRSLERAGARALTDLADLRLLGRYKRYYVAQGFGRPILSGRHLLQLRQVNLRFISDRSFRVPEDYVLREGWTVFTCDGRSEEQLGSPAYVHKGWNGWLASNHVMRAIPKTGTHPGYLYLALCSPYVQIQLKARATGSVIDALEPESIADVLLPDLGKTVEKRLGVAAERAWDEIAAATHVEEDMVMKIERLILQGYEVA